MFEEKYINENIKNPGWISVISLFLINFYIFGIIFTWGIFQKLYLEIYSKEFSVFQLSFVGTTSCSFVISFGIIVSFIVKKIGYKKTMLIGTVLCTISLVLASFSINFWQIYVTQGLLFGIVISFVYFSPFIFISIYSYEIGFNSLTTSILIGVMIGLNSFGRIITGYISDKIGSLNTMIICTILSGLSNLILCINVNKHIIFIIYVIFYGITGNNIFSLIPIFLSNIVCSEKLLQVINICYMSFFIGTLIRSPILGIIYNIYGTFIVYIIIGSFTIFSSFIIIFLKLVKTNNIFEKY